MNACKKLNSLFGTFEKENNFPICVTRNVMYYPIDRTRKNNSRIYCSNIRYSYNYELMHCEQSRIHLFFFSFLSASEKNFVNFLNYLVMIIIKEENPETSATQFTSNLKWDEWLFLVVRLNIKHKLAGRVINYMNGVDFMANINVKGEHWHHKIHYAQQPKQAQNYLFECWNFICME